MILCSHPLRQYLAYKTAINKAVLKVLTKGQYVLGEQVKLFEKEFAKYVGVKYGIGVSCGTEALHLALRACGIGYGDEVITVSHTAVVTVQAIELCGAVPVLVDIEPNFYTIDPQKIKKAITKKTKAIIPVHLYGQPADLKPILKIAHHYKIKVIEDCCQAHGAKYFNKRVGSFGDIACFSFYPTKNLGCFGDGGLVVTNNKKLAGNAKLLRMHGWKKHYISYLSGWNSCLDELQAAVLRIKLKYLDKDNKRRGELASIYNEFLRDTNLILPARRENSIHVYHLYVVRTKKRDQLKKFLEKNQIYPLIHYPVPIHKQPAYKGKIKFMGDLSVTEKVSKEILSLPIYPELKKSQLRFIIKTINNFFNLIKR